MAAGIYAITNKGNGKQYIGQSWNIKERWKRHLWMLTHKKHHNRFLQEAWDTWGESYFTWEVLEVIPCNHPAVSKYSDDVDKRRRREKYHMRMRFNQRGSHEYNTLPQGTPYQIGGTLR